MLPFFACPAIDERAESGRGAMLRKVILNSVGIDVMVLEGTINLDESLLSERH
jgi:hypothetical protein